MLNRYFIRPTTVDRICASWIGEAIERYVVWLDEQNYAAKTIFIRVPILLRFGEFARAAGAQDWEELPTYVEPFIEDWLKVRGSEYSESKRHVTARSIRNSIEQLLRLILPDPNHAMSGRRMAVPFEDCVPDFFRFLRRDRGLREATIVQYRHYLSRLQEYLTKVDCSLLPDLSPALISTFISESGQLIDKRSVQSLCSILKTFFRYLYRVGLMPRDLSKVIESPRRYRLAELPRSISWAEVQHTLEQVDRRDAVGKRDFAILLLLVTYGLRAREVAALRLDNIDWKRDRLHIQGRKAGHSSIYRLTPMVGAAILDYLQLGRRKTMERALFTRAFAPYTQLSPSVISQRAKYRLTKAGIKVSRPGSHTFRHTCVQRLVDSGLSLKTIGDFLGHRTLDATRIYTKVNIQSLREVALGDGEEVL